VRARRQLANVDAQLVQRLFLWTMFLDQMDVVFDHPPVHRRATVIKANERGVDPEERRGPDDASGQGGIVSDDCVLDGIREREQDDKVEGVELGEDALAERPQCENEEEVNSNRPQHLLQDRDREVARTEPEEVHAKRMEIEQHHATKVEQSEETAPGQGKPDAPTNIACYRSSGGT
jgi:hypothetical protein